MDFEFAELLKAGIDNPEWFVVAAIGAVCTMYGVLKLIPFVIARTITMSTAMVVKTVRTTVASVRKGINGGGKSRTLPRTTYEFENYQPRKGDTWIIRDKDGMRLGVHRLFRENGTRRVEIAQDEHKLGMGDSPRTFVTSVERFRRDLIQNHAEPMQA